MTIEQDVKNWLADEGVFREKAADENADFHFVIEFPKDNVMDVVKAKLHCIMLLNYDFGNLNNNNSKPHNENSMFV